MLTLLQATNAYIASGLACALLLLAALGVIIAGRSSTLDGTARRAADPLGT